MRNTATKRLRHQGRYWRVLGVLRVLVVLSLVILSAAKDLHAQRDPSQEAKTPPQKSETAAAEHYRRWLTRDVIYVITDEEAAVFQNLTTDDERDKFIEQFWLRRDTDPSTSENEFKVEHYRRIQYANEKFTAGIPGWKTDRGRIYIMFGPPDRKETNPAGGSYERERKEGGGHTSVYPFERWEYRHIEGAGDDIELEFVDDKGGSLYELTFDNQRKDELINSGFMGPTWDEIENYELTGNKWKRDRVLGRRYAGELGGYYKATGGFETQKDQPFSKLMLSGSLNRAPSIKYKDLEAIITTKVSYTLFPFQAIDEVIRVSDSLVLVPVTLSINNSDITYENENGVYTGRLEILGQVSTVTRGKEALFEHEIAKDFPAEVFEEGKKQQSIFQKQLFLKPGVYKLELVVKDTGSGKMGTLARRLEAPNFATHKLACSSVVIAGSIEPLADGASSQFVIGSLRVIPRVDRTFSRQEEMGFYFQIYNAAVDQTTSKPRLHVEFAIVPKGREVSSWRDITKLAAYSGTHTTVARIGSLQPFQPGQYELHVHVMDRIAGSEWRSTSDFWVKN